MKELISGKEAYFAIGEGLIVQKSYDPIGNGIFGEWEDLDPSVFNIYGMLKDSGNDPQFRFRIKPRTVNLNGVEVGQLYFSQWDKQNPKEVIIEFKTEEDARHFNKNALNIFNGV